VLLILEQYGEAHQHFEEGRTRYKSMGNQLYEGYALMNLGNALWGLGNYDEARKLLGQSLEIAQQKGGSFTGLQASVNLVEARTALSERKFAEAEVKSRQALELAAAQDKAVAVQGKYLQGLSQALSGRAPAGTASCQEAVDAAAPLGDPLLLANAQLALAEAALAAGDIKRAIESSRQAQTFFDKAGLSESNWRALLIAGLASQRAGDHVGAGAYLKNARDTFTSLETKWGADPFKLYQSRPDIQFYRRQLDQSSAAMR